MTISGTLTALAVAAAKKAGTFAAQLGWDWWKRSAAANAAAQGGPGAQALRLESLVRDALKELAAHPRSVPLNISREHLSTWLQRSGQEERFAALLIQDAGAPGALKPAQPRRELASLWEAETGDTSASADGVINYVLAHLTGVIGATDAGKQSLALGLQMRSASGIDALLQGTPHLLPDDDLLAKAREVGRGFYVAAARTWRLPSQPAPLALERCSGPKLADREPSSFDTLLKAADGGASVVLFGAGGIGKTTLLLQLCESLLAEGRRVPLFLDAATWARTNKTISEYLAGREQASASLSPQALGRLTAERRVVLLVNGWNEIAADARAGCLAHLEDFLSASPSAGLVVTTREHTDLPAPKDSGTEYLEVRGLVWKEQVLLVRARLPAPSAERVLSMLATHTDLRRAARSPLIMQGVLARADAPGTLSTYDLLAGAIESFEAGPQRAAVLAAAPLDRRADVYLEQLACELTSKVDTVCSRDEANRAINAAALRLQRDGVLSALPHSDDVSNALVSQHLLQLAEEGLRFAHQRFQEYFAARRVLKDCSAPADSRSVLKGAVRSAGWEEVLRLVAGKLRHEQAAARAALVSAALEVDLGLACDLAGLAHFARADGADVFDECVRRIGLLADSPHEEVRELATSFRIATGWPDFAAQLWPLLESDDQQARLATFHVNRRRISVVQLGPGAAQRISAWPKEKQSDAIHGFEHGPENLEFLEHMALTTEDAQLREAAVAALLWNYPASDRSLLAWSRSPVELQLKHLSSVAYALENAPVPEYVTKQLAKLGDSLEGSQQLQFALEFPQRVTNKAMPALLQGLSESGRWHSGFEDILALAMRLEPAAVHTLASELVLTRRDCPEWVWDFIPQLDAPERARLHATLLDKVRDDDWETVSPQMLGRVSDLELSATVIEAWSAADREDRDANEPTRAKARYFADALMATQGDVLLQTAIGNIGQYTYEELTRIVQVLLQRVMHRAHRAGVQPWKPQVPDVYRFLKACEDKLHLADGGQAKLQALLTELCMHAGARHFKDFILAALVNQLELELAHKERVEVWRQHPMREPPANPYHGRHVAEAAAACGFEVIPDLMELTKHPAAGELISDALVRIVTAPWCDMQEEGLFAPTMSMCAAQGRLRAAQGLVAAQPRAELQPATDLVAEYFASVLLERIAITGTPQRQTPEWHAAQGRLKRPTERAASVPSRISVPAVKQVLGSGKLHIYGTDAALRSLLRMGVAIEEPECIRHVEALVNGAPPWHMHEYDRHTLEQLASFLVCTVPDELLQHPGTHYLEIWLKLGHWHSVQSACESGGCLRAWEILEQKLGAPGENGESAALTMAKIVDRESFSRFLGHVRSGALFGRGSSFLLEQQAPRLAALMREDQALTKEFEDACRQSPTGQADKYFVEVMSHLDGSLPAMTAFLLQSLDAGRVRDMNSPGADAMLSLLTSERPIGANTYEVLTRPCIELRVGLYQRSRSNSATSVVAQRLLAKMELHRREGGRPDEEPRHPFGPGAVGDWTQALLGS